MGDAIVCCVRNKKGRPAVPQMFASTLLGRRVLHQVQVVCLKRWTKLFTCWPTHDAGNVDEFRYNVTLTTPKRGARDGRGLGK